jgi:ribosome-associated translation inhibitor RaiA
MLDHLVFLDCPERIREDIRAYWAEKLPRFERLLARFTPELRHLRLAIRHAKGRWETRAVLTIPTATLAARRDAEHWSEALDGLADRLASEIRRHKARLRHDDAHFHQGLHAAPWQTAF